jgi:hypothetical protein
LRIFIVVVTVALGACVTPNNHPAPAIGDGGAPRGIDGHPMLPVMAVRPSGDAAASPDAAPALADAAPLPPDCTATQHMCGSTCFAVDDRDHCGPSCLACPSASNGSVACSFGKCTVTCADGYHQCGGPGAEVCKSNLDVASCGSLCEACPSLPNATALCNQSLSCALTCDPSTAACLDADTIVECAARSWDFEDGLVRDWGVWDRTSEDVAVTGTLAVSSGRAHSGSQALRVAVTVDAGRSRVVFTNVPCGKSNGVTDQRGKTASFQLFIEGAPVGSTGNCGVGGHGRDGRYLGPPDRPVLLQAGRWNQVTFRYDDPAADRTYDLALDCFLPSATVWSGAVYLDDVSVN